MNPAEVSELVAAALEGRRLLSHPFYLRWEAGELSRSELARYAEQYRHMEAALPRVLAEVAEGLPEGPAQEAVMANLADELGNPAPHLELFEDFAEALDAACHAAPCAATRELVGLQLRAAESDPGWALGVIASYEAQAAEIAASKALGLRRHYGLDMRGSKFWSVHAELEATHAGWSVSALASVSDDPAAISAAVREGADAWWAFLDEREAEAA